MSRSKAATLTSIDGGYAHMCVLDSAGDVRCWGDGDRGQLGYGDPSPIPETEASTRATPVRTGGLAVQLSVGGYHTCVVLDDGTVRCWGDNRAGQLGVAWPKQVELPTEIGYTTYRARRSELWIVANVGVRDFTFELARVYHDARQRHTGLDPVARVRIARIEDPVAQVLRSHRPVPAFAPRVEVPPQRVARRQRYVVGLGRCVGPPATRQ